MRYLVAADAVHEAAAICDYLQRRLEEGDEVHAVTVHATEDDGVTRRDHREALNVVEVRLVVPSVETEQRRGDVAEELLAAARETNVDELVLAIDGGGPGSTNGCTSTVQQVLANTTRPVALVPLVEV